MSVIQIGGVPIIVEESANIPIQHLLHAIYPKTKKVIAVITREGKVLIPGKPNLKLVHDREAP